METRYAQDCRFKVKKKKYVLRSLSKYNNSNLIFASERKTKFSYCCFLKIHLCLSPYEKAFHIFDSTNNTFEKLDLTLFL